MSILKRTSLLFLALLLLFLAFRAHDSYRGVALQVWHSYTPKELLVEEIELTDWEGYLKAEAAIFTEIDSEVVSKTDPAHQIPANRYYRNSPVNPLTFSTNWNRSFMLKPDGEIRGAAVFLHGLTDSPYSFRHIATRYQELGFLALVIRLPGHGTVPAGLAKVSRDEWTAATRLALREARERVGTQLPLHLVGYSNGGALALHYALDTLRDESLAKVDRLVLLSPMIGITEMSRFAGVAGWPAIFPAFAKAAWVHVLPEYNPFKYNSLPINAASQSWLLTRDLQPRISAYAVQGRLEKLPPILTFQSVVDATVKSEAVITALYNHLPNNGSELVLFDINRSLISKPLLANDATQTLRSALAKPPRNYTTVLLTNSSSANGQMVERVLDAGGQNEYERNLDLRYPSAVFSLSHVSLPFPLGDSLYGLFPEPADEFGISLGTMAPRGERDTLIVSLESMLRLTSNPFYSYMLERMEEDLVAN